MMHTKRRWTVGPAESAADLARKLTETTWTRCAGFFVLGHPEYLFLNDATSEDAAQECAVVKRPADPGRPFQQLESITMSWCSLAQAQAFIEQALAGEMDGN